MTFNTLNAANLTTRWCCNNGPDIQTEMILSDRLAVESEDNEIGMAINCMYAYHSMLGVSVLIDRKLDLFICIVQRMDF